MKSEDSKWLAVVGTREVDPEIRRQLRHEVQDALKAGWSIVSGGATGVDHEVARLVYQFAGDKRLKIFLPTTLKIYAKNLRSRAKDGKCQPRDANATIRLLCKIQRENPSVIIENPQFQVADAESFHYRNDQIIAASDRVLAFRVNNSRGATYTIETARAAGKPVAVFDYTRNNINY
jgi:predicted Rossmann fold nucleotide-binding protein DprA/Smf involved in DNA uptake